MRNSSRASFRDARFQEIDAGAKEKIAREVKAREEKTARLRAQRLQHVDATSQTGGKVRR